MLEQAERAPAPRVLIVDDDPATRRLFARTLGREGLSTFEARDGEEALELLQCEPVSLVLLDGQMPGLSGIEVIERLRKKAHTAMLPVMMVTATDEVSARVAGLEAGADDYLSKPVDLGELVARIHTQLRRHRAWQDAASSSRKRASVIESLACLPRGLAPESTAASAIALLSHELPDAAIVAFSMQGASVLSACGALETTMPSGTRLGDHTAERLRELCERGPWGGPVDGRSPIGPFAHAACGVPLVADGRLLGSLLVGPAASVPTAGEVALLSTALGIGPVVSALLAPAFDQWNRQQGRQADFARVLDANSLRTHFQPVVDLASNEAIGFEALSRWTDGARPDARLAVAREAGRGDELERMMIANALTEAHRLPPGCWLSVNMSAVLVLHDPGLGSLLARSPRPIVVELTEQEPVEDYERLAAALGALGDVQLAVDDAGAGYSSLRHILALQPSLVKLDREWIHAIDHDEARQALVAGLQLFAGKTGCSLIAEGIETEAECDVVRRIGIPLGQGYHLGRPQPLANQD